MSCTCQNKQNTEPQFACSCDGFEFPPTLNIGAGLTDLPRQIATFGEFRRAMLFTIHQNKPALNFWRARNQNDLGMMMLEMWAYICDSLSFYDKVIAQEAYLRTAILPPSLRRLVALLGYLPRPAVAGSVQLAALADGRLPVNLPAKTAFRSSGFNGNPAQVFELETDSLIHPFLNQWNIRPPHFGKIIVDNPNSLLIQQQADVKIGSLLLLIDTQNATQNQALRVKNVGFYSGNDGKRYTKVEFESSTKISKDTPLDYLKLLLPNQSTALWTATDKGLENNNLLFLNNQNAQIRSGDFIILERSAQESEARWFKLNAVGDAPRSSSNDTIKVNGSTFNFTAIPTDVTQLTLDVDINNSSRKTTSNTWSDADKTSLRVHFQMLQAGTIVDEAKLTLSPTDPLLFDSTIEYSDKGKDENLFILFDKNKRGETVNGKLNFDKSSFELFQNESWNPEMTLPVQAFGNIIYATRGESVRNEILGNGNASIPNQTFKLKKSPLTYLPSPTANNEQGIQSTLVLYVNNIKWHEVASFYNKKPDEQIYIVRQNDDGDSLITFGDGIRGQRVPTGANNVIAFYRFGAGKASPPTDSITQIATPLKGLQSIKNPVPATEGADAEATKDTRKNAPKSALILGRVVSIQDMEAVTLSMPGVKAVQVEWRWSGVRQTAVAHIFYIGGADVAKTVSSQLNQLTEPNTPIQVEQAQPIAGELNLDIEIDNRYVATNVLAEVKQVLTNKENGILSPQNIGIGKALFRSLIFEKVLSIAGTKAVNAIFWNQQPFNTYAQTPGTGKYFDFELGKLLLNPII